MHPLTTSASSHISHISWKRTLKRGRLSPRRAQHRGKSGGVDVPTMSETTDGDHEGRSIQSVEPVAHSTVQSQLSSQMQMLEVMPG